MACFIKLSSLPLCVSSTLQNLRWRGQCNGLNDNNGMRLNKTPVIRYLVYYHSQLPLVQYFHI